MILFYLFASTVRSQVRVSYRAASVELQKRSAVLLINMLQLRGCLPTKRLSTNHYGTFLPYHAATELQQLCHTCELRSDQLLPD